jgi:hypothetical protein
MPTRVKPKPPIEPGHVEGADLTAPAIAGPPSVVAEASLEAEAARIASDAARAAARGPSFTSTAAGRGVFALYPGGDR